jgi:hypothetical protein
MLAAALKMRDIPTTMVAMSDSVIEDARRRERQEALGQVIDAFRLSRRTPMRQRIEAARAFLDDSGARHVMFAMVCYDYDRRGIMWRAARQLPALAGGRSASILFHETWIGEVEGSSLYIRCIGAAQRMAVKRFVRHLAPGRIYTTNPTYRAMLGARGIDAEIVPHCGNIPVDTRDASSWLPAALAAAGFDPGPGGLAGLYLVGLFGTLYPGLDMPSLLPTLEAVARRSGRRLCVATIGRQGARAAEWQRWHLAHGAAYGFVALQERPPAVVSQFLNSLDLGVASTSLAQIGKSGTAAAFREHGIPTLVPVESVHYRFFRDESAGLPDTFLRVTPDLADRLGAVRRGPPIRLLDSLADRLAVDIRMAMRSA